MHGMSWQLYCTWYCVEISISVAVVSHSTGAWNVLKAAILYLVLCWNQHQCCSSQSHSRQQSCLSYSWRDSERVSCSPEWQSCHHPPPCTGWSISATEEERVECFFLLFPLSVCLSLSVSVSVSLSLSVSVCLSLSLSLSLSLCGNFHVYNFTH